MDGSKYTEEKQKHTAHACDSCLHEEACIGYVIAIMTRVPCALCLSSTHNTFS
jgi:hypothetical protein